MGGRVYYRCASKGGWTLQDEALPTTKHVHGSLHRERGWDKRGRGSADRCKKKEREGGIYLVGAQEVGTTTVDISPFRWRIRV